MKKLSYALAIAALSLVSTNGFAQEVKEVVEVVEAIQQDKVEIELSALPEVVTKALAKDFAGYNAHKAYTTTKDEAKAYYIVLSKDDAKIGAYYNEEGKLIEKEDIES